MPLVKVNLRRGRSAEEKDSLAASIQTALVSTPEVPEADRYQLFKEYDGESFRHTSEDARDDAVAAVHQPSSAAAGGGRGSES
jgi:phenylpyruvate tautomerase PptA (4-oxalocrotonate tautomerase family)